jgi:predicted ATPase/class 3 adenylate cyclase
MTNAPTGTVTFLFTDVEGSTRLWEEQPDASTMLKRHDELIESIVAAHEGVVVRPRGEGDSRFCVFGRATDGVAAAAAIQLALSNEPWSVPLSVRIAVHSGEAEFRDGDYFGAAVNRCARLRAVAHGGQVLLSAATEELIGGALPDGCSVSDLGLHRLRDLSAPLRVFQLRHAGLRAEFPPLSSLDAMSNNLPVQLTSFVGRDAEVAEIRKLLAESRLVTLTGAAGCGKTRHALQSAAELLDAFPDGAWFVDLAPVADPALVPQAIARALGLQDETGTPAMEMIIDSLRARRSLVLLDNCEHVLAASAEAATGILLSCPAVSVLATARESLGVGGETSWRVPSLSLPDASDALDELTTSEAARLFVDRAHAACSELAFTDDDAPAIAKICSRLDGIPLAIELAAARVGVLAPDQIASRLDDHLRLLTGGSRTALERQQTLRAAVDWSHALLSDEERVLLRRLSVFAGGFTLEPCEEVCSGGAVARVDTLDLLSALVGKSLVVAVRVGRSSRYRLLETMRQYAREKLIESPDAMETRARHLAWCRALVREAEPELHGPQQVAWFQRLDEEHDNIRAALTWAIDAGDAEAALSMVDDVAHFWDTRGRWAEGSSWIEAALAVPGGSDRLRGWALFRAGLLAGLQLDIDAMDLFTREAMELGEVAGDRRLIAWSFMQVGAGAVARGLQEQANDAFDRSQQLAEELGDMRLVAQLLSSRALPMTSVTDAQALLQRALPVVRDLGDVGMIGYILVNLGVHASARSEYRRARILLREALEYLRPVGHKRNTAAALQALAMADFFQSDYESARPLYAEAAAILRDLGGTMAAAAALSSRGALAFMDGDFAAAADAYSRFADLAADLGVTGHEAWIRFLAGNAALLGGRHADARVLLEGSGALFRERSGDSRIGVPLGELALLELEVGNLDEARERVLESLRVLETVDVPSARVVGIERAAAVDAASGNGSRVARLLGAAEVARERLELPIWPSHIARHEDWVAQARGSCDAATFDDAWAQGRELSIDDAFRLALEDTSAG